MPATTHHVADALRYDANQMPGEMVRDRLFADGLRLLADAIDSRLPYDLVDDYILHEGVLEFWYRTEPELTTYKSFDWGDVSGLHYMLSDLAV